MLRTRILLIAMAILLLVIGLFVYGAWLRDHLSRSEREALQLETLAQSWSAFGTSAIARATAVVEARLETSGALPAVEARNGPLLSGLEATLIGQGIEGVELLRLDLYDADGGLLFSSDRGYLAEHLLGQGEPLPLQTAERLVGTRVGDGTLRGLAVAPLTKTAPDGTTERIGTLALVLDLAPAIEALARAREGRILVLDRAGAPVRVSGGTLGAAIGDDPVTTLPEDFDHTRPMLLERDTETGRLSYASVLTVDVGGGRSATLVVVEDVSRSAEARRFTDLAWLLGAGLLGLVPLVMLWVYLRRAFEPLDEAVDALRQLAAGRTDHYAELTAGDDEIGHIGRAIEVFRQNALELERNADLEERRRRRQARFIRRQMTTLSETLDEEAQASALEDLRQIEAASTEGRTAASPDVASGDTRFSDQLGLIGVALERMTARVRSQQQALSELIDELREALEMKTRLISLEQELDIARQMQQNVLPRRFPSTPGFEIAAMMQPAREVGGDFYDIFQVDAHRVGVAVADVSGKGIPAAFFMLIARTLLKAIALEGAGPGKTLARLNDFLCGDNEETMFVTLFYGELDSRSGRFTYANGGHNHPLLATPGEPVSALPSTDGMALAVFDQQSFAERTVTLASGQTLLLYTDGVTEAFDARGTMFGDDQLAGLLAAPAIEAGRSTAQALLETIIGRVERFCEGAPQSDDITLIVIAARPTAATLPFRTPEDRPGDDTSRRNDRSAA
jgi:sigma-B regulation protein RsbU (phosphoserine phosphatase)